jgi:hypothetical protein
MSLYDEIVKAFPELNSENFAPWGEINLRNDSDGTGDYIVKWEYNQELPKNLKTYLR